MRKNMYNNDILMINKEEIVFLEFVGTEDHDLKQICRDFLKIIPNEKSKIIGVDSNSFGVNENKLDAMANDIVEGLKRLEGNVGENIFLDTVKEACLDALIRNEVELALRAKGYQE